MRWSGRSFAHSRESIDFRVSRTDRKTLTIAVHPDRTVEVKAPLGTDEEEICRRVSRRADWIRRQQRYFEQFEPRTPARRYVGGETHLYLGKRYRLKISYGEREGVRLTRGYFEISLKGDGSPEKIKALLDHWYREKASVRFHEVLDRLWGQCFERSVSAACPRMQIRQMKKRWGSLSAKGLLTLNADLIRAPGACIDYVMTHELCHLRYKEHGPGFYRFMAHIMPDWEKRKHQLEFALA